jgi:hypothetical protein
VLYGCLCLPVPKKKKGGGGGEGVPLNERKKNKPENGNNGIKETTSLPPMASHLKVRESASRFLIFAERASRT